jgi:putative lipoprotein
MHVLMFACMLPGLLSASEQLADSKWLVEDISGRGVIDNLQTTLEFGADGRVDGRAGCNRWTASWRVAGDNLALGPAATTRMACTPAVGDQEQKFLAALAAVRTFRIDARGLLILLNGKGASLIRASRH